jgi:hypothetical protein
VALQTFTAGQVLTASQVTALQANDYNQTVSTKTANYTLLAADKGTRLVGNGTSITFTVDNTIFSAGDTLKIHNINSTVLTIAAGAGVTINAAAGLTIAQWQEAVLYATSASSFILFESTASSAQGLTLLNTTSFSGVSSQSVNDVFSATYTNYKIVVNQIGNAASGYDVKFRLRVAGADASTNTYKTSGYGVADLTSNNIYKNQSNGSISTFNIGSSSSQARTYMIFDILNPFRTEKTTMSGSWSYLENDGRFFHNNVGGIFDATTSFTGFTIFVNANNITGEVSTYGYNI